MSSPRVGDRVTEKGMTGEVVALRPQNMVDVVFEGRDYPMRRPAGSLKVLRENPAKPKMPVFAAAVLTPEAKKQLYRWWATLPAAPEPLPILKSTHMTIKFRPSLEEVSLMPLGQEVTLQVTGWAGDGSIQAVSVEPVGVGSANAIPHVTFAIKDPSVAPKLSNDLLAGTGGRRQSIQGPALKALVGWSDGGTYHFEPPKVEGNPGPRGGLTAEERESLRASDFALPGRRWPINDRRHAIIALQYILRKFGNAGDYPRILAAIEKKYPRADKRNAEIWEFHAKHFGGPARLVANPNEIGPVSRLLEVSYEDSPAYFAAEPFSIGRGAKERTFTGRWVLPSTHGNMVSTRFADAVADHMVNMFKTNKTARLTEQDRQTIFDRVNRETGSHFSSLADFEAQQRRMMDRFEAFMHAYMAAPEALQMQLMQVLRLRKPLRRGIVDVNNNPAGDVYDPAKEQFRAQTQAIYESQVIKKLGLHYKTPFMDESGRRLDAALSPDEKRKLFSSAFAMATRQGQKHGYLEPGTQTPTEKGRARAFERLAISQVDHAAANRQDWERTLAGVRKGPHFRVVAQQVNIGRGRTTTHYIVQPRPEGLVAIPPYRVSERAAQQDALKAEQAYARAGDSTRVRFNPRKRAALAHVNIREEEAFEKVINQFMEMPRDKAIESLLQTARVLRNSEATARRQARIDGTNPDAVTISPDTLRFLQAKLDSRDDLPYKTVEEVRATAGPVVERDYRDDYVFIQREVVKAFPEIKPGGLLLAKWSAYKLAQEGDQVRAATEGAKVGGIAGSNKNREDSGPKEKEYREELKTFNDNLVAKNTGAMGLGNSLIDKANEILRAHGGTLIAKPFKIDDGYMVTLYKPESELAAMSLSGLSDREAQGAIFDDEVPGDWRIFDEQTVKGDVYPVTTYYKLIPTAQYRPRQDTDFRFDGPLLRRQDVRKALAKFKPEGDVTLIELDLSSLMDNPDLMAAGLLKWRSVPGVGLSPHVSVPLYDQRLNRQTGEYESTGIVVSTVVVPRDSAGNKDLGIAFDEATSPSRLFTRAPFTYKALTIIERPAAEIKSMRQELALDRQQEEREAKKFVAEMARIQQTSTYYDVERVVLLYRMDESDPSKPRKRYFTYTLEPRETLEQVLRKFNYEPGVSDTGVREPLPTVETRYVLYIPRKPRWITKREMAGGTLVLGDVEGRKGFGKSRAKGLAMEDQPEGKRAKRKVAGFTDYGLVSPDSYSVYPSMLLTKFFQVDPAGLGGGAKLDQAIEGSQTATKATSVLDDLGTSPDTLDAAQLNAFSALMKTKFTPRVADQKKVFLSPDENWVKYKRASNVFRRLKQGVFNTVTNQFEGGIRDLQTYDVFYTNNAALAYLTIMYFNTPGALPHVDTEIVQVRNVLKAIKSDGFNVLLGNNKRITVEKDDLTVIEGESAISKPKITKRLLDETAEKTRGGMLRPIDPRQPLSVTTEFFDSTELGAIMQRMSIEEFEMSMAGIKSRSAFDFEQTERRLKRRMERERKIREAVSAGSAQAAQASSRTRPTAATPKPPPPPVSSEVPEVDVSDLDFDFNNNPFTRSRGGAGRPARRTRR